MAVAQRVEVLFICDMEHDENDPEATAEGVATVSFGLDGAAFEIDGCTRHAEHLRKTLEPFVTAARRSTQQRGRKASASESRQEHTDFLREVRAWAKAQGVRVNDRGRVAGAVVTQYKTAHGLA